MANYRATDLSYGHLGEASYDVDEQNWFFSRNPALGKLFLNCGARVTAHSLPDCSVHPLEPLQQRISPSFPDFLEPGEGAPQGWQI